MNCRNATTPNARNAGDEVVTVGGDDRDHYSHGEHRDDPGDAVGIIVVQFRHGNLHGIPVPRQADVFDRDADGGGRNGNHRSGQEAEHHAVGQVVKRD
jgi:hypothetical protein